MVRLKELYTCVFPTVKRGDDSNGVLAVGAAGHANLLGDLRHDLVTVALEKLCEIHDDNS